ncbi:MAG: threonylcarbamoyl-AMP synthase [Spirochaetales bacterium]|nr:threonylcarbamoyl-AMP synthase [Spirochaetales bacterium]
MILSIPEAVMALRQGRTVIVPTETVYGLAARVESAGAVQQIFQIKKRPPGNPLILHFADTETMKKYTAEPDLIDRVARFWPGPLTLLVPHGDRIPRAVTAGSPLVACRIPDHPLLLQILKSLGEPLAAPSANLSGRVSPTCAGDIDPLLLELTAGVVDGGPCRIGIESTIISFTEQRFHVVRPGMISEEQLRATGLPVGDPLEEIAPGQSRRHYAPPLPLILLKERGDGTNRVELADCCYLDSGRGRFAGLPFGARISLSMSGRVEEVAHNLFSAFHKPGNARFLVMEPLPAEGSAIAINDRISRAATLLGHISGEGSALLTRTL